MSKKRDYIKKVSEMTGIPEKMVSAIIEHEYQFVAKSIRNREPAVLTGLGTFCIYSNRAEILDIKKRKKNDSSIVQSDIESEESDSKDNNT